MLPTHVQYFTRESLSRLLRREGYTVLEVATAPKVFTVRYYITRIRGYSPTLARLLASGAERLAIAERPWGPDFRDRMMVLARPGPVTGAAGAPSPASP